MEKFEECVLDYICGRPGRFVNTQFDIPYDGVCGGSCPDLVVVDFADRTIYVVEVTAAASASSVISRVKERDKRWLDPLRRHFRKLSPTFQDPDWDYHVSIFVRGEQLASARLAFEADRDVSVLSLDDTVFS